MKRSQITPHLVLGALTHNLGLTRAEGLLIAVDDRSVGPGGANEADALRVGRQLHRPFARHSVARVEHSGARHAAEHSQVFEGHLGGAVLS